MNTRHAGHATSIFRVCLSLLLCAVSCVLFPPTALGAHDFTVGSEDVPSTYEKVEGANDTVFTAKADNAKISAAVIVATLEDGWHVGIETGTTGTQKGSIIVTEAIAPNIDATKVLVLQAAYRIEVQAAITANTNGISFIAKAGQSAIGDDGGTKIGQFRLTSSGSISTNGGSATITGYNNFAQVGDTSSYTNNGETYECSGDTCPGIRIEGKIDTGAGKITLTAHRRGVGQAQGVSIAEIDGASTLNTTGTISITGQSDGTEAGVACDGAIQSGGNTSLTGDGDNGGTGISGSGSITTTSGSVTLQSTSGAITGSSLQVSSGGGVTISSSAAMSLGAVSATGTVDASTQSGNLTLAGVLETTDSSTSAVTLNAGKSEAAGTSTGGDVVVSGGSVSMGDTGTAMVYTGSISGSLGVTGLAEYQSRYLNSDENSTLNPEPGTGLYVVYRGGEEYSVTYNGNNNTGGTAPTDANKYSGNASVTVKDKGTLTRTGYNFKNWNNKVNGSGASYAPNATFNITADTTLYAQWSQQSADTSSPIASAGPNQTVTSGTTVSLNGSGSKATADGASIDTWAWAMVSGPANPTINNSTAKVAEITPTTEGTYTYKLTVTDSNNQTATDTCVVNVSATKKAPIARASGSASVSGSSATVTLGGSTSVTRDGSSITAYAWALVSGPATPTLSDANAAQTTFSTSTAGAYAYRLTVTASNGLKDSDITTVNVFFDNKAPTAAATAETKVAPGTGGVQLDGSGSTDSDGTIASYSWTQLKGAAVTINNADQAVADFKAPDSDTGLLFQLTVTDNDGAEGSAEIAVNVTNGSVPDADAGGNQNKTSGETIYLNGCDSTGNSLTFAWKQTSGPIVTLYDADTCKPYFYARTASSLRQNAIGGVTAQSVRTASSTSYAFELLITDSSGFMSVSGTSVTVSSSSTDPSPTPTPSPTPLGNNLLLWRNNDNGKVAFWRLNTDGQLDTSQDGGWGYVSDNLTMSASWQLEGEMTLSGYRALFWRNTDSGEVVYWQLSNEGKILNETEGDGWGNVSNEYRVPMNWKLVGLTEINGNPTLFWQDSDTTRLVFWKLNGGCYLENATSSDVWGLVAPNEPIREHWRVLAMTDIGGKYSVIWRNTESGSVLFWQLDDDGRLLTSTRDENWGEVCPEVTVGPQWTLVSIGVVNGTSTLFWYNPDTGNTAYWRVDGNANILNTDKDSGWGFVRDTDQPAPDWNFVGSIAVNSNASMLWYSDDQGRVCLWSLSTMAKFDSWEMVNPDTTIPMQWRMDGQSNSLSIAAKAKQTGK